MHQGAWDTEYRIQNTEYRSQNPEVRIQNSGTRNPKLEPRATDYTDAGALNAATSPDPEPRATDYTDYAD
jgi:hypothetical protein